MNITSEKWNDWVRVVLLKDFTVQTLFEIRAELERLELLPIPNVVLDFEQVHNLDSSAINLMLNYSRRVGAKNGRLVIVNTRQQILDVFKIVDLEDSIPVYETWEDFTSSGT